MNFGPEQKRARKLVTNSCLISTDVDKTLLSQESDAQQERLFFLRNICPHLIRSARLGVNICFLTGNSMEMLVERILPWMLDELCLLREVYLLERFHFFCNAGGVYAHFSTEDEKFRQALLEIDENADRQPSRDMILDILTYEDNPVSSSTSCPHPVDGCSKTRATSVLEDVAKLNETPASEGNNHKDRTTVKRVIHPRFLDECYIRNAVIPKDDLVEISEIMEAIRQTYNELIRTNGEALSDYDIEKFNRDFSRKTASSDWPDARIEKRPVRYGKKCDSVQITLRPILSFKYARNKHIENRLFRNRADLRSKYIKILADNLESRGLGHYAPRPGGRASIDVTMEKLDKAYALRHLINHLNLQGHAAIGQFFGSNTIYLGDEVLVGGGNDYVVSKLEGLLVLAVNKDRNRVPFRSNIYVPSTSFAGPQAVEIFLEDFNRIAEELLEICEEKEKKGQKYDKGNAVVEYKRYLFRKRIASKVTKFDSISADQLQIMHALISLMCRTTPGERKLITLLARELDDIMEKLEGNETLSLAIGDSYDEAGRDL